MSPLPLGVSCFAPRGLQEQTNDRADYQTTLTQCGWFAGDVGRSQAEASARQGASVLPAENPLMSTAWCAD